MHEIWASCPKQQCWAVKPDARGSCNPSWAEGFSSTQAWHNFCSAKRHGCKEHQTYQKNELPNARWTYQKLRGTISEPHRWVSVCCCQHIHNTEVGDPETVDVSDSHTQEHRMGLFNIRGMRWVFGAPKNTSHMTISEWEEIHLFPLRLRTAVILVINPKWQRAIEICACAVTSAHHCRALSHPEISIWFWVLNSVASTVDVFPPVIQHRYGRNEQVGASTMYASVPMETMDYSV